MQLPAFAAHLYASHINKATVIALAVLGSMLVFIMIVVIAYCVIKGDTSRDKYDPIH